MSLRDQLQKSLGAAYTLDRELGGGGMSRVFVARDESLRRNIVVKVLPPELLGGVNLSRFSREIQLAAGLQHPHIVPVHSTGEMDGLPYYTMPFIDGESLRVRLARGPLSLTETIGILRDVARALAYAHERGVVHRDIKPDNVLLSGGSATVTDFGIAKALVAAKRDEVTTTRASGGTTGLTSVGMSIGTPAYMAPEQAAGDPATDHRADIYSFGCLAYELLSGRPPFTAKTAQKLLAAHMAEAAQPVSSLRPDTPPALADLVMRCLAKDADDRPQSASDLVRVLDSTTSSGSGEAMPQILLGGRGMLKKAMALYVAAFVVVTVVAKAAIVAIGLPDWVFPGALVVMALGLPVILFTAYVHRTTRRALLETPTYTPGGTPSTANGTMATIALRASPHMSWRRTAVGGAWAFGAFIILVGTYMLMRAFGIGPAGSLLASGALAENERVLVADFPNPANDTTLGPVVTEAFRTALSQSQSVQIVQPNEIRDALRRMLKPAGTRVDFAVAREMATRDGIRAVVEGNLISLGGKYKLAAQLKSPQSGDVIASFDESAASEADLLPAIDKLAKAVRAKIGESLRKVQAAPPLEQVTTPSLEALKKYITATRMISTEGDSPRALELLQEAISLDTGFAMAYRRYAASANNRDMIAEASNAIEKAYSHRDRLTEAERYLVTGGYYQFGPHANDAKSAEAYERLIELQPDNGTALNNLSNIYSSRGQQEKAALATTRAAKLPGAAAVYFVNAAQAKFDLGHFEEGMQDAEAGAKAYPNNPTVAEVPMRSYVAPSMYDTAAALAGGLLQRFSRDTGVLVQTRFTLSNAALVRGHVTDGLRIRQDAYRLAPASVRQAPTDAAAFEALYRSWYLGDTAGAVRVLDDTLARHPLDTAVVINQAFFDVVDAYATAGRLDKARAVMARWENLRRRTSGHDDDQWRSYMKGTIAVASKNYSDAVKYWREASTNTCPSCSLAELGRSYDLAGNADSAIAVMNRFIDTPFSFRGEFDAQYLAGTHKRLGELYEARGDRENAIKHYSKFVDLWKTADPALQPKVAEVKAKLVRLSRTEGTR